MLSENRFLTTLRLTCCNQLTDVAGKALAAGLETNRTLTTLDTSWITQLGEPTLSAFIQALTKNRTLTTLNLTGCKCMGQIAAAAARNVEEDGDTSGQDSQNTSPSFGRNPSELDSFSARKKKEEDSFARKKRFSRNSTERNAPSLSVLLQRNRDRPVIKKTLASSALGGTSNASNAKDLAAGQSAYGRRGLITTPLELLRTLRATIINGAALYNAEDAEGCFKLFTQTAESVVASTRSPIVADAMMKVNSIYAPREIQQKIWLLRSAFDEVVDELENDDSIYG